MAQPTTLNSPDPIDRAAQAAIKLRYGVEAAGLIDPDSADTVSAYLRSLVEPAGPTIPRQAAAPAVERTNPDPLTAILDNTLTPEQKISVVRGYLIRSYERDGQDFTTAAARVGATVDQAANAVTDWVFWSTGHKLLPARTGTDPAAGPDAADCPTWCAGDCLLNTVPGYTIVERNHARTIADMNVADAAAVDEQRTLIVDLSAFTSAGVLVDPTTVRVMIEKDDGRTEAGVALTPAEAAQLGAALVEAARIAEAG